MFLFTRVQLHHLSLLTVAAANCGVEALRVEELSSIDQLMKLNAFEFVNP